MKRPIEVMEAKIYDGANGVSIPYRIYVPDTNKKCSLLLFLHGAGERGNDNRTHITIHEDLIERAINDDKKECIVIAPQCPNEMQWVNTPWANGSYSFENIPMSTAMECVIEILELVKSQYSINDKRMYVAGMSMGGYGTWNILMHYPNMFAAAIPVCGAGDPNMAEKIKHIPIRVYHNADDTTVPVSGSREMVEALKLCNGDVTYSENPDGEHNSWYRAYTEPDILEWLFSKEKE